MIGAHIHEEQEDDLVQFLEKIDDLDDLFHHVRTLKKQGNRLFKKVNFKNVQGYCEKASKLLPCVLSIRDESNEFLQKFVFSLNLNMTASVIKLHNLSHNYGIMLS